MFSGLYEKLILRRDGQGKMEKYNRTNTVVGIYEISYHILGYPRKLVPLLPC